MSDPWLILETSGCGGQVGLAVGDAVVSTVALDPARRHNRDLAPAARTLLDQAGLTARDLHGVMVSVGPGSFTGLRVGVMSAKTLAFALGCELVAVPTFHAIAEQAPAEAAVVDVIADALKGLVYTERFQRTAERRWEPVNALRIEPLDEWLAGLPETSWVSGPGLDVHANLLPATVHRVADAARVPGVAAVYRVGMWLAPLDREAMLKLEPLYVRASTAEEKAAQNATRPG